MDGYSQISVSAAELLQPGDRVEITWDIYQGGTWLVNYQALQISQAFERDTRVKLHDYRYDASARTFSIDVEILNHSATVETIADIAMAATWEFALEASRRYQVFRPAAASMPEDPGVQDTPQQAATSSGLAGPAVGVGLVVLAWLFLGD
ncbi:MAG: hypothetical protein WC378_19425 [Opitutaceae bacterium]|jgi:hypothetical protein